ncbi:MAG: sulfur transferase domain-containing protein [Psychrobacter sp.]|nr:sulfur transferase domain-containing protein [Psychrobacter sp.]
MSNNNLLLDTNPSKSSELNGNELNDKGFKNASVLEDVAAITEADGASVTSHEEKLSEPSVKSLSDYFDNLYQPNEDTLVCGALDEDKVKALAQAGFEHIINLQPEDELTFDEAAAAERHGLTYSYLPIGGAQDLKQINLLAFDKILREYHGKKIVMHCKSGNRVGAAMALRAGWLRGRKMETALERGRAHGLTSLEDEVRNRLLVPR